MQYLLRMSRAFGHGWTWFNRFSRHPALQAGDDQVACLASTTPMAMIGYLFAILVVVLALRGTAAPAFIAVWASVSASAALALLVRALLRQPQRVSPRRTVSRRNALRVVLFAVLLALPWGILFAAISPVSGPAAPLIVMTLMMALTASGVLLLAPFLAAACMYASIILLPFAAVTALAGDASQTIVAGLAAGYWLFLIALLQVWHRTDASNTRIVRELESSVREISIERESLERAAMTDALTGLANRRALLARTSALNDGPQCYALYYIDLDRFKATNDTLGHDAGDRLLVEVAKRLCRSVRPGDLIARMGGDEFAIVATNLVERSKAISMARRILNELTQPFLLEGHAIDIGASIGIALSAEANCDGDTMLKSADIAMYEVKSSGRNGFRIFDPSIASSVRDMAPLEHAVHKADIRLSA